MKTDERSSSKLRQWASSFARVTGIKMLGFVRVGKVGSIQLANLGKGGAFYRSAHRAVCWMFEFSPHRYHRLARRVPWLVNKPLIRGTGAIEYYPAWNVCFVDFRDFGNDDLSAGFLACSLVEHAFLIKHGASARLLTDEQVVRLSRNARRDAFRFVARLGSRFPKIAEVIAGTYPEFSETDAIAYARKPHADRSK